MRSIVPRWTMAAVLAALLVASPAAGRTSAGEGALPGAVSEARIRSAIVAAVRARMGDDADVIVDALDVAGTPLSPWLQAVPEPNARLGDRLHFRLLGSDGRGHPARVVGAASADITVHVAHVRMRALVPRGRELADGDVEASHEALIGVLLRRLPRLPEVAGTRTLVNLAPGEVVARTAVALRPAVKSGQLVRGSAAVDGLVVTATLVAVQDGAAGAVIRVVNKDSRRELRARVVAPGVVEVIP